MVVYISLHLALNFKLLSTHYLFYSIYMIFYEIFGGLLGVAHTVVDQGVLIVQQSS